MKDKTTDAERKHLENNHIQIAKAKQLGGELWAAAIDDYLKAADGFHSFKVVDHYAGRKQECQISTFFKTERVDQDGGGYSGDDYHGDVYLHIAFGKYLRMSY